MNLPGSVSNRQTMQSGTLHAQPLAFQIGYFLEAVLTQLSNILGGKIWSGHLVLALFLIFSRQTFAALPLATIQDVIYNADGTRFNGVAGIEWRSFQAADGSLIAAQSVSVSIINGNLRVRLVPTANASAGARYTVRYSSGGQIRFTEYWSVPISSALLHLRDIRTNSTGQLIGNAAVIEISDVGGLQDELDSRPLKGFGFAPNRVVTAGSTGALETVSGSLSDCVHVDGSAGPCGSSTSSGSSGPGFIDLEVPAGLVNGANATFTLSQAPFPASSVQLYRNGILLKQGLDFTLAGNVVTFSGGSIPKQDDILSVSFRLLSASQISILQNTAVKIPQVICSASGATSSSSARTNLGNCTIPANAIVDGDRIEVRYTIVHAGNSSAINLVLKWGDYALASQSTVTAEAVAVGNVNLSVSNASTVWATQTWGGRSPLVTSAGLLQSAVGQLILLTIDADVPGVGTDSVILQNFSVIRYPGTVAP